MTVKAILSVKGGDVISIEPTATLETAVKMLAKHGIGALLVLGPDRRVVGILSERDIVRALGEQGADVLTRMPRIRPAADDELLRVGDLELAPVGGSLTRLVERSGLLGK